MPAPLNDQAARKIFYIMNNVQFNINEKGHGHFLIPEGEEQIAEMEIRISENNLTVHHTSVLPKAEGKGYAKKLLSAMVDHARKHHLKVTPLCPFVHAQFKRHPGEFADIWNRREH